MITRALSVFTMPASPTPPGPPAPLLWALIDEGALYRPVARAEIMHEQLMHPVTTSRRPNITIQVVPYSAGGHTGGQCVEAGNDGRAIAVRDSQDPDGTRLTFTAEAWRTFAATLKGGWNS